MHLYLIRMIAGNTYWQVVERLPPKLESAITHRWERLLAITTVVLFSLTIVSFGFTVWRELPWGFLLGGFIATLLANELLGWLNRTYKETYRQLRDTNTWSDYLVPESSLLFSSIMLPELKEYLINWPPQNPLPEKIVEHFEIYYPEAFYYVAAHRRLLKDEAATALDKIRSEHDQRVGVYEVAEEFALLIIQEIRKTEGITLNRRSFFSAQRARIERDYQDSLEKLASGIRAKIDKLVADEALVGSFVS